MSVLALLELLDAALFPTLRNPLAGLLAHGVFLKPLLLLLLLLLLFYPLLLPLPLPPFDFPCLFPREKPLPLSFCASGPKTTMG